MANEKLSKELEKLNLELDEIALQKRLEIEAEHLKRIKCTRFLRIFGSFSGSSLKINTRVLNETGIEEKTPFWSLVKRICVCFNTEFTGIDGRSTLKKDLGNVEIFEWTKNSNTEGFIVPINNENTNGCKKIQILVKLANQRNVFKLSPPLSNLLNKLTETRCNLIKDIYKYVNANKLNDYATSNISCDEALEKVFGVKSFNFNSISTILEPHLQPIFYCVIDVENKEGTEIWDIELETDDLNQMPVLYPKNVQQLEKKIEDTRALKKKISDRIDLLKEFHDDPALFINRKIALESEGVGVKSGFYDDLNVQTSLFELIKKKE